MAKSFSDEDVDVTLKMAQPPTKRAFVLRAYTSRGDAMLIHQPNSSREVVQRRLRIRESRFQIRDPKHLSIPQVQGVKGRGEDTLSAAFFVSDSDAAAA